MQVSFKQSSCCNPRLLIQACSVCPANLTHHLAINCTCCCCIYQQRPCTTMPDSMHVCDSQHARQDTLPSCRHSTTLPAAPCSITAGHSPDESHAPAVGGVCVGHSSPQQDEARRLQHSHARACTGPHQQQTMREGNSAPGMHDCDCVSGQVPRQLPKHAVRAARRASKRGRQGMYKTRHRDQQVRNEQCGGTTQLQTILTRPTLRGSYVHLKLLIYITVPGVPPSAHKVKAICLGNNSIKGSACAWKTGVSQPCLALVSPSLWPTNLPCTGKAGNRLQ